MRSCCSLFFFSVQQLGATMWPTFRRDRAISCATVFVAGVSVGAVIVVGVFNWNRNRNRDAVDDDNTDNNETTNTSNRITSATGATHNSNTASGFEHAIAGATATDADALRLNLLPTPQELFNAHRSALGIVSFERPPHDAGVHEAVARISQPSCDCYFAAQNGTRFVGVLIISLRGVADQALLRNVTDGGRAGELFLAPSTDPGAQVYLRDSHNKIIVYLRDSHNQIVARIVNQDTNSSWLIDQSNREGGLGLHQQLAKLVTAETGADILCMLGFSLTKESSDSVSITLRSASLNRNEDSAVIFGLGAVFGNDRHVSKECYGEWSAFFSAVVGEDLRSRHVSVAPYDPVRA
jgi:hypothetical protein